MPTVHARSRPSAVANLSAAVFAALTLCACTMSDDKLGRLLVAPDKYVLYTCPEMVVAAQSTAARERQLEQLMAKAGQGADGRFVSAIAYRPDYLAVHAEMNELRSAAAAKNCTLPPGTDSIARAAETSRR
jgi:hypothetical protein